MSGFDEAYAYGLTGESKIAQWWKTKGYNVMPVYEKLVGDYKGPSVFLSCGRSLVAPDMLAFNGAKAYWVEAKHKSAFTWHRITSRWVTGIDTKLYSHYLELAESMSPWPVILMFLHDSWRTAKDTPIGKVSPCGLYGQNILTLRENVNHRHENWANGMVYWAEDAFIKLM